MLTLSLAALAGVAGLSSPARAEAAAAGATSVASRDGRDRPGADARAPLAIHPLAELPALLPQLARGRPLVVHVCATWCVACRDELERLGPLLRGLEKRGVSSALIWIDGAATRAAIPKQTARYHLGSLPALILDAPDPAPVAHAFHEEAWDGALPATFVYDEHQEKLSAFLGAADPGLLRAAIDEAVRRARPAPHGAAGARPPARPPR